MSIYPCRSRTAGAASTYHNYITYFSVEVTKRYQFQKNVPEKAQAPDKKSPESAECPREDEKLQVFAQAKIRNRDTRPRCCTAPSRFLTEKTEDISGKAKEIGVSPDVQIIALEKHFLQEATFTKYSQFFREETTSSIKNMIKAQKAQKSNDFSHISRRGACQDSIIRHCVKSRAPA